MEHLTLARRTDNDKATRLYADIRNVLVISDDVGATQFISFRNPFLAAPEDARPQFHFSRHLKFKSDMQARFDEVKPDMIVDRKSVV